MLRPQNFAWRDKFDSQMPNKELLSHQVPYNGAFPICHTTANQKYPWWFPVPFLLPQEWTQSMSSPSLFLFIPLLGFCFLEGGSEPGSTSATGFGTKKSGWIGAWPAEECDQVKMQIVQPPWTTKWLIFLKMALVPTVFWRDSPIPLEVHKGLWHLTTCYGIINPTFLCFVFFLQRGLWSSVLEQNKPHVPPQEVCYHLPTWRQIWRTKVSVGTHWVNLC